MACSNCGFPIEDITEGRGGIQEGQFEEVYVCGQCEARGKIQGDAAEPSHKWTRMGQVFEA